MTIPIPHYSPNDFGQILYKLIQILEVAKNSGNEEIFIDLSETKFLPCIYLSGLYNFIRMWRKEGKTVNIRNDGSIKGYLDTIRFENEYDTLKDKSLIDDIKSFANRRFIPIVKFPTHERSREDCINTICELIKAQTNLKGQLYQALSYFVSELSNNIADHSKIEWGIMAAQSYPKLGFIDVTFADHGIGLRECYISSGRYMPESDTKAIDLAMNGVSTKEHAVSRGFGLSTSKSMLVKGLEGKFVFWSGKGIFIETSKNSSILEVESGYSGCFIAIRLPLATSNRFQFYDFVE